MRDIYVRHRNDCRYASPNAKKPTRLPARLVFGCGCPIYARLQIRHPDPCIAPFEFNGSLSKLGVREKLAAEELVEQWTVQFLSTGGRTPDPNTFKSVEQATRSRRAQRNLVFGIHIENADCRPANAGLSNQINSAPLKMVVPILPAGME